MSRFVCKFVCKLVNWSLVWQFANKHTECGEKANYQLNWELCGGLNLPNSFLPIVQRLQGNAAVAQVPCKLSPGLPTANMDNVCTKNRQYNPVSPVRLRANPCCSCFSHS